MQPDTLYKDLLQDFKSQKEIIDEQIDTFEPLTASLRMPAAQRLFNKGILILLEYFFYLLAIALFTYVFFINHLVPFYILNTIKQQGANGSFPVSDVNMLYWAVIAMVVCFGVLFFYIARLLRKIRLKNNIIHTVTKNIKALLAQHLQRKAAIKAIEQRHFGEWTAQVTGENKTEVNEVPNQAN
jgi:hypothetical protein